MNVILKRAIKTVSLFPLYQQLAQRAVRIIFSFLECIDNFIIFMRQPDGDASKRNLALRPVSDNLECEKMNDKFSFV